MRERGMGFNRRDFLRTAWTLPAAGAGYWAWETRRRSGPVRAALVGCGLHGRETLLRECPPSSLRFVAVCDPRPSQRELARQELVRLYGPDGAAVPAVADVRELLDHPGIDALVVAAPTPAHARIALDGLKARKHVYLEAPIADNVFDAKAVAKYAKLNERDLVLAVGHQRGANPKYHAAAGTIGSGGLGEVRYIECFRHFNATLADPWRGAVPDADKAFEAAKPGGMPLAEFVNWRLRKSGGGVFGEYLAGQFDALRRLLGNDEASARPVAVFGVGGKHLGSADQEVEDHVYLTLELPKDRIATWACAASTGAEGYGELVLGTRGTLWLTGETNLQSSNPPAPPPPGGKKAPRAAAVKLAVSAAAPGAPTMYSAASTTSVTAAAAAKEKGSAGFAESLRAFADAIRSGAYHAVGCNAAQGLANAVVAYAAQTAVRKRQRLVFDDRWFNADDLATPDDRPKDESLGKFAGLV